MIFLIVAPPQKLVMAPRATIQDNTVFLLSFIYVMNEEQIFMTTNLLPSNKNYQQQK